MVISVTIQVIVLKCSMCNPDILLEGSMSQNSDFGFCLMLKKGNFWSFFSPSNSTFHKMITMTYIKILRHTFLHLDLKNPCLKCEASTCNID